MKTLFPFIVLLFVLNFNVNAQIDWNTEITDIYSFSSPRATDLNGDGVKDIVQGAGVEGVPSDKGIFAVDGADGSILWTAFARDQIFGSPVFMDINDDGTDDVFIGGRAAEFQALDGTNGEVIWEFYPQALAEQIAPIDSGVYQFYTPQIIIDVDQDGLPDLLNANGGDPRALLPNDPRPAGKLMIISSATGELLAEAEVPDGKETYMSPLVADFYRDGDYEILFGTGGESNEGGLWRVSLDDLIQGDISNATELIHSDSKGFIAPPSLADLNADNVPDIISNSYDGRITAINGRDNSLLWENSINLGETNASPGIGYFNDDDTPDIYSSYAIGLAPTFLEFTQLMIDGKTGEVLQRDSLGLSQFTSPLVIDFDEDGIDEVVFCINDRDAQEGTFNNQILLVDFNDATVDPLTEVIQGTNVNSTPYLGNLDNDGNLDIVFTHNVDNTSFVNANGIFIKKISLSPSDAIIPSWGAYLGNNYDAVFYPPNNECFLAEDKINFAVNPGQDCMTNVQLGIPACENNDCTILWEDGSDGYSNSLNGSGRHTVSVILPNGCVRIGKIDIPEFNLDGFEQTNTVCASDETGSIRIDYSGGQPPYQILWNGEALGGQSFAQIFLKDDLPVGNYSVEILDNSGCSQTVDFEIINENPAITVNWDSPLPEVENQGVLNLNIEGGTPPYFVFLDDENVQDWNTIENLTNQSYELLIIDSLACQYTETVEINLSTGIESILDDLQWAMYPNPSKDIINISIPENEQVTYNMTLRMYDSIGRLVLIDQILPSNGSFSLNTQGLCTGVYLVEIEHKGYTSVKILSKIQ